MGTTIDGRYQLTRLLASGSLGSVYEGMDMKTGLEAAVKLFPSLAFQGESRREQFLSEAARVTALRHPNLVRYFGFGFIRERSPFVAMERLHGLTLGARLREVGLLPMRSCLRILSEVLRGLSAAHDKRAAHRNLRPQSVFLDRRGAVLFGFGFGLDKQAHERLPLADAESTPGNNVASFAPVEATAALRDDLYAVSAMAYHMLTGRVLADPDEQRPRGAVQSSRVEELRPPSALQAPIDPELDEWVMRGLCEEPSLRFASAREMSASCEQLLDRLGG